MNKQSPTFCVMPHLGLSVQNEGDICVCNLNNKSLSLNNQLKKIDEITIDEIWHSPTRSEIIDQLDNGIKHPRCNVCWDSEDAGKKSTRLELNEIFKDVAPSANQPKILIIKPGNTCNAACRICGPETSSGWYSDSFKLAQTKNKDLNFKTYIKNFESIKNSFNPDSPNLWPVLNNWYKELLFLDIYGGEPFMIPGLWSSLQEAINFGYAQNISLRISTNASIWNEEYMHILSKFKSVDIGLSIDSHISTEFEYMRYKLDFNKCIDNGKKIINFVNQHSHMSARVSCTPSILNIWNIKDIVESLGEILNINISFTNFVYSPEHFDIRHLPKNIKQEIIKKLKDTEKFHTVLNFMDQVIPGCVMQWPKFCMETDKLDNLRGTKFKDVYPVWHSMLEPYWDYKHPNPLWYGSCGFNS
jgi:MoaA/NifB/PqqE/SkfB family radical SAM enzyme